MKQEEKSEKQIGNQTDPVLQYMRKMGYKMTQKTYLALGFPEGIDSESAATLPKEFHSLPKE